MEIELVKSHPNNQAAVTVTEQNFEEQVVGSKEPVLVEFWTWWSKCCKAFETPFGKAVAYCGGRLKVARVNADDNPDLSLRYAIRHIPTLIYFEDGNVRRRLVGALSGKSISTQLRAFSATSEEPGKTRPYPNMKELKVC